MFLLIESNSEPPGSFKLFSSDCRFFWGEANGLKFPSTLRCGCVLNSVSKDDSCCVTPKSPPTSTLRITQMTSETRKQLMSMSSTPSQGPKQLPPRTSTTTRTIERSVLLYVILEACSQNSPVHLHCVKFYIFGNVKFKLWNKFSRGL